MNTLPNKMKPWYEIGISLATPWAKIYRRDTIRRNHIRFCQSIAPHEDGFFNLCLISSIDKFYVDNRLVYHYVYYEDSAIHKFSNRLTSVAINIMPMLEDFVSSNYLDNRYFYGAIVQCAYFYVRTVKENYFTHPHNTKSFRELKCEMDDFLSNPKISKWLKQLKLSAAEDMIDFKNRLLLKLHLYWIFLITERRKNKKL